MSIRALLSLAAIITAAASANAKVESLQGEYTRPSLVLNPEATDLAQCASKNNYWISDQCYALNHDTVSIHKIEGTSSVYAVTIFVSDSKGDTCHFFGELNQHGSALSRSDNDGRGIRISRHKQKLVVEDNQLHPQNCSSNTPIGLNGEFIRQSEGTSVDAQDGADIAQCGFKGCLN